MFRDTTNTDLVVVGCLFVALAMAYLIFMLRMMMKQNARQKMAEKFEGAEDGILHAEANATEVFEDEQDLTEALCWFLEHDPHSPLKGWEFTNYSSLGEIDVEFDGRKFEIVITEIEDDD